MKICFVTDTFCDVNGVSRFLQDMLQIATTNRGDELYLITSTRKTSCKEFATVYNLKPLFSIAIPYYKELDIVFPSYKKIKQTLEAIQPDTIHISTPGLVGFYGLRYARKHNIPIAGTYHTDFPSYVEKNTKVKLFGRIIQSYMRYFYKDFQLLFARSDAYLQILQEKIVSEKTQLQTLKPGTDTQKFNPSYKNDTFREKYNIPSEDKIFLYVGRITQEKNVGLILNIFTTNIQDKKATLLLAGSGNIKEYKAKYNSNRIRYLGNQRGEKLSELYANADCFIFPSITDTLGQVVLEALSSATPVIVSDIGGPKEIVNRCKKDIGFILNHNNKALWIETIEKIINDKIELEQLSYNAREYALTLDIQHSYEDFISHHKLF